LDHESDELDERREFWLIQICLDIGHDGLLYMFSSAIDVVSTSTYKCSTDES
jgi:hypothetical protein